MCQKNFKKNKKTSALIVALNKVCPNIHAHGFSVCVTTRKWPEMAFHGVTVCGSGDHSGLRPVLSTESEAKRGWVTGTPAQPTASSASSARDGPVRPEPLPRSNPCPPPGVERNEAVT